MQWWIVTQHPVWCTNLAILGKCSSPSGRIHMQRGTLACAKIVYHLHLCIFLDIREHAVGNKQHALM